MSSVGFHRYNIPLLAFVANAIFVLLEMLALIEMHEMIAEKKTRQVNVRLDEQVYKRLQSISYNEDSRVTDLIRKAIRKTYGTPKK